MIHAYRTATALLGGAGLLQGGIGLVGTLVAVRLAADGATVGGVVLSAYFAGLLLGALIGGALIRRVGHIRAFAFFAAVMCASALGYPLVDHWAGWAVFRFGTGFGMAGVFMVTESWLTTLDEVPRGSLLAAYMVTNHVGLIVGQVLFALGDPTGVDLFIVSALLFSLGAMPVALTRRASPTVIADAHLSLRRLARLAPVGVVGAVVSGLVYGAVIGMGPIFAVAVGYEGPGVAVFMTAILVGGVVMQWPIGHLGDRVGREKVFLGTAAGLAAASAALVALPAAAGPALVAVAGLHGGLAATVYPLALGAMSDRVPPDELVPAAGGLLIAYAAGAAVGPLTAGVVMETVGASGLYVFTGAVGTALLGFRAWRLSRSPALPADEQAAFVFAPRTTVAVSALLADEGSPPSPEATQR